MQNIPGGAAAQPFITKHNALGCNFYLRIALELYHKRLLVGGVDKLFEIGKNFRNEGLSRKHNPEFTMLEAYDAYGDYETMMDTVESLICHLAEKVLGTLKIEHDQRAEVVSKLTEFYKTVAVCADVIDFENPEIQKVTHFAFNEAQGLSGRDATPSHVKATKGAELVVEATRMLSAHLSRQDRKSSDEQEILSALTLLDSIRASLQRLGQPKQIDLTRPWKRARYKDLVREKVKSLTGIEDWFALTPEQRRKAAIEDLKLEGEIATGYEDFEVTGAVFEKLIEPTLIQPTFVTHLPKELVPLAKLSPDDPTTVEVFECCINGQEISPGYTEQNDPIAQRDTLEHQAGGMGTWFEVRG